MAETSLPPEKTSVPEPIGLVSAIARPGGVADAAPRLAVGPRSVLALLVRALGAGLAAGRDLRRLNNMTEGQLAARGLSRADLPRALFERHFAG